VNGILFPRGSTNRFTSARAERPFGRPQVSAASVIHPAPSDCKNQGTTCVSGCRTSNPALPLVSPASATVIESPVRGATENVTSTARFVTFTSVANEPGASVVNREG